MEFQNVHVAISGGTGGLGQCVSTAFLAQGATVYSSYVNDHEVENLPQELQSDRFHTQKVDLTDEAAVQTWLNAIPDLKVMINIAGGFAMAPFEDTSLQDWHAMMHMNLDTAFLTSRTALSIFRQNDFGRIINIGAFAATQRMGGMTAYKVSKAAVIHMTESLAEETLQDGITVNAVLPTIMDTATNRAAMPDADFSTWIPLACVADTILHLAKTESWPITGACIPIRGKNEKHPQKYAHKHQTHALISSQNFA